jgi:hypothetical protein
MVAKKVIEWGTHHYVSRLSWVDVDNVAEVAALSVSRIACRQNVQTWL